VRYVRAIALMLGGIGLITTSGHAGVLTATWRAPLANTDGSPLTDLALYRVYYSIFASPCPGSTFAEVASPGSTPGANETVSFQLTGLTAGAVYTVSVSAVDAQGNESACSDTVSAAARDDSSAMSPIQDPTSLVPETTAPQHPTGPVPEPTPPKASSPPPPMPGGPATTPDRFCPPDQARQGRC